MVDIVGGPANDNRGVKVVDNEHNNFSKIDDRLDEIEIQKIVEAVSKFKVSQKSERKVIAHAIMSAGTYISFTLNMSQTIIIPKGQELELILRERK